MTGRPAPRDLWTLWVDASFYVCRRYGAAGIVLMNPQRELFKYHHPLSRVSSAVEAEHRALLLGLVLALAQNARSLTVFTDATINAHAYHSTRGRPASVVRPRYRAFRQLADTFKWLEVIKVPRAEVAIADAVAGNTGDSEGVVRAVPLGQLSRLLSWWPSSREFLQQCA